MLLAGLTVCADADQPVVCPGAASDPLIFAPFSIAEVAEAEPCRSAGSLGAEFHGTLSAGARQLRYAAFLPSDVQRPETFIAYIPGGPGARILEGFALIPGAEAVVRALASRCQAAVLVPAYTGTADVSRYPDSSIGEAILDVDVFLKHVRQAAGRRPVVLLTSSLGTYLYANSSKGQVDAHIAMIPLLRSPAALMRFVINDTTPGGHQEIARNYWRDYRIGPSGLPQKIRVADFARAFYGQWEGNRTSLSAAYLLRPAAAQEQRNTRFFLGVNDLEAGPFGEFEDELRTIGLSVSPLRNSGHSVDKADTALILQQVEQLLPEKCAGKSR